jgi:phenylacetate-CoA ligase
MHDVQPFDVFQASRWARASWEVWLGGWADASALEQQVSRRLDALVRFARCASPLYRELYAALAPQPTPALIDLPVVNKALLMQRFDEAVTDPRLHHTELTAFCHATEQVGQAYLGRYAVWTSSGTSGEPGCFVHDRDALAVYEALELLRFHGLSSPLDWTTPLFGGERYAMVAATGGHFAGIATVERLRRSYPWLAPQLRSFSLLQPLPALLRELQDYQPTLLATYPTAAEMLAAAQEAGHLHLPLRELWTGGECLPAGVRARLTRAFGCRVRNSYGASEFLSIAADCERGTLHANTDWVCLEPVDAHHRPVPPGSASHSVLLTNLANRVQPLIRYDLGDSVTLHSAPCACGSALPALTVEGRHDDVLSLGRAPGVTLLPLVATTVLEEQAGVHDFQLVQTGRSALRLSLGRADSRRAARARAALAAYLRTQGAAQVRIELADASPARSRGSGKLRRVVAAWKAG